MVSSEKKKQGFFCCSIVYLFLNYFRVIWMTMGEVFISRTSCKRYKDPVKCKVQIFQSCSMSQIGGFTGMISAPAISV